MTTTNAAVEVTEADRDAAADLIEAYWAGFGAMHLQMQALARSYRSGHSQGLWAQAFARHRLAHTQPAEIAGRDQVAKLVHEAMRWAADNGCTDKHPEWQGGNSFAEDKARSAADAILKLRLAIMNLRRGERG